MKTFAFLKHVIIFAKGLVEFNNSMIATFSAFDACCTIIP